MSRLIEIRELHKIFVRGEEEIAAIDGINLQINQGEFVSITGASGSGKSTLLYLLGLLDRPSSGEYLFDNLPTEEFSDDDRAKLRNESMGFIFQSFHLLPRADATRNVTMPLEYRIEKLTKQQMREMALASLNRVGLADRVSHLPNQLSGGQRQRVAIARALVNNPKVILADEPTGNLDSKNAKEILNLFQQLNSEGRTILLVTHDREFAELAPRTIRLKDGRIEEDSGHP